MAAPSATAPGTGKGNVPVLAGLLLGVLLAALDQTVVGTSLGKIVADVGGFEHFAWLFSAYMLASTIAIPIAGKLSDIYGRRPVYLMGMVLFLLGSALCGTATSMTQLILYRGIQGLGGGAIFPVAIATIADLYPPSERGRVGGLFGAVFGISSVVGPFLGGWIVDNVHLFGIESWRWVFYVNLPLGALGITMVATFFPRVAARRQARIDYAGIATLTLALTSGLLVTVWGGETYAWTSVQILGLGALALASTVAFLVAERRAEDAVLPLGLFREPIFAVSAAASVLMGAGMFTVISFMPTYLQGVLGVSATYSGSALIPLSLGIVAGSAGSGALMKRVGYKPFAVAGPLMAALGFAALFLMPLRPAVGTVVAILAFLGVGIGFTIQTFILASQNAVERRHVGVATSSITLFRTLGATVGVTLLGVLLNRRLARELPERVPPEALEGMLANGFIAGHLERIPSLLLRPEFVAGAPPHVVEGVKDAFASSVAWVWLGGALVCAAALLVALFLRSRPMKTREEYMGPREGGAEDAPAAAAGGTTGH